MLGFSRLVSVCVALAVPYALSAQATARLAGRVLTESTDQPIAGATIALGRGLTTESDSLGQYRIAGLRPERYTVLVRRLGFTPVSTTITLAFGDSLEADFLLSPLAQVLPGIEVQTPLLQRKLVAFEERRRFGIGRFLSEAELQKAPGSRLSEKVRQLPGLTVIYPRMGSSNAVRIASSRGQQSLTRQGGGPCFAAIMLDGVQMTEPFYINTLDVGEVAAIEWYSGPAQMPAQYNSTRNTCGLLIIWTK